MTLDLFAALRECYHGQAYSLNGETYDGLKWNETNTLPKPTLEEIEEKWNEYVAAQPPNKLDYRILVWSEQMLYMLSRFQCHLGKAGCA